MPAFIFDLDGTLVDSVYQHVRAWNTALTECDLQLSVWRIHRRIGMSGGPLVRALMRELGREIDPDTTERLKRRHAEEFQSLLPSIRPLPGARELLRELSDLNVKWTIATSAAAADAAPMFELLGVPPNVPVTTRDDVDRAKPDPDVFLTAAQKLGVDSSDAMAVGDSVWDMLAARRAHFLSIGILAGGYGATELEQAGAYRVYADPDDLRRHLDEVGVREEERT
ncbi:MAG TPA: HAD family hydrolase [Candidatus Baltobacteraceae bacterium]